MKRKITVILAKPENPENIGLVARNMKNTGFEDLRLVKLISLERRSYRTAVHARDVLEKARFYSNLFEACDDLDLIFAATSKRRKNFPSLSLKAAVTKMFQFPLETKIGLLFGNERTGLTSEELKKSNFRFTIPQASRQPSYNIASAVLLTLFQIVAHDNFPEEVIRDKPLSLKQQEECIRLILEKLERKRFIHKTNRQHMTEMICDLFGRLTMTSKDRKLLLALFSKATDK